jgi:hypothetical protein
LIEDYKTAQSDENVKIHTKLTGIYLWWSKWWDVYIMSSRNLLRRHVRKVWKPS